MKRELRRQQILNIIRESRTVSVIELSRLFKVSEMTIRRDLDALSKEGALYRTYGGATLAPSVGYEPPYAERIRDHQKEKAWIAEAATEMVDDGDVIIIDFGSTCMEFAAKLVGKRKRLTVVTCALPCMLALASDPNITVVVPGGVLVGRELSLVGKITEENMSRFHVDKFFMGISGVTLEKGLTEHSLEDGQVKQSMLSACRDVILLADHSKFGKAAFYKVADIKRLRTVITDIGIKKEYIEALENEGISVRLCGSASDSAQENPEASYR